MDAPPSIDTPPNVSFGREEGHDEPEQQPDRDHHHRHHHGHHHRHEETVEEHDKATDEKMGEAFALAVTALPFTATTTPAIHDTGAERLTPGQQAMGAGRTPPAIPLESAAVQRSAEEIALELPTEGTAADATSASTAAHLRDGMTQMEMLREMLAVAAPSAVSVLFTFATQTIAMSFVGHRLGYLAFAQYAVGSSVFNVLGASIGFGFGGALDTLAPQAFGRDQQTTELNVLIQRASFLNLCLLVPLVVVFYNVEPLLVIVFGETLGPGAARYLRAAPPLAILQWQATAIGRTFSAQLLPNVPLASNIVGSAATYFLCDYLLTAESTLVDAVWCLVLVQIVTLTPMVLAALFHPKSLMKDFYRWRHAEVFDKQAMKDYIKLGLASMFGTCSEWWQFELLQVICAQIGEMEVAAFTIMLNLMLLCFSMPLGVSIGGGTMVGNALGAGLPSLAKRYSTITFKVSVVTTSSLVLMLYLFGHRIFAYYSADPVVLNMLVPFVPYVMAWHAADAVSGITIGIFRGVGETERAAIGALVSLWLIGMPLAAGFGLWLGYGLKGVITGEVIGTAMLLPIRSYDYFRWDWKLLAERATAGEEENGSESSGSSSGSESESDTDANTASSPSCSKEEVCKNELTNAMRGEDIRNDKELNAVLP